MQEFMRAYRVAGEDKIPVKTIGPQVESHHYHLQIWRKSVGWHRLGGRGEADVLDWLQN